MNISISKSGIIWSIFVLLGCILLYQGFTAQNKYAKAVNLAELDRNDYEYGDYVVGDIDFFLKKEISNGKYTGASGSYGADYEVYTIPIYENAYARIMVNDRETKKLLEAACDETVDPIPFEGILIKSPISVNHAWYEKISGVDVNNIAPDFVIVQKPLKRKGNMLYLGLEILFICLFLRITNTLEPVVAVEKKEDMVKRNPFSKARNLESELQIEQRKLERLQLQQVKLQKSLLWCVLFWVIGSLIWISTYWMELKISSFFFWIIALRMTVQYLLNQPNEVSIFCARVFHVNSIPMKIEQCQKDIANINALLEEGQRTLIYSSPSNF